MYCDISHPRLVLLKRLGQYVHLFEVRINNCLQIASYMYYGMELNVFIAYCTLWPLIHRLFLCSHRLDSAIHGLYSRIILYRTEEYKLIDLCRYLSTIHPQPSFYLYLILQIYQRFWAEFFSSFSCTLTKVGTLFFTQKFPSIYKESWKFRDIWSLLLSMNGKVLPILFWTRLFHF